MNQTSLHQMRRGIHVIFMLPTSKILRGGGEGGEGGEGDGEVFGWQRCHVSYVNRTSN